MKKNVANQIIVFPQFFDGDGMPVEEDANVAVVTTEETEVSEGALEHVGLGIWKYQPTQAETNHDSVAFILAADDRVVVQQCFPTVDMSRMIVSVDDPNTPPRFTITGTSTLPPNVDNTGAPVGFRFGKDAWEWWGENNVYWRLSWNNTRWIIWQPFVPYGQTAAQFNGPTNPSSPVGTYTGVSMATGSAVVEANTEPIYWFRPSAISRIPPTDLWPVVNQYAALLQYTESLSQDQTDNILGGMQTVISSAPVRSSIREAVGLADANLDDQLASIQSLDWLSEIDWSTMGRDWSDDERSQIRHQLGIDGDKAAPTPPTSSPVVITPGGNPSASKGYTVCLRNGLPLASTAVNVRLVRGPGDAGYAYDTSPIVTHVSDDSGLVEIPGLVRGATYVAWLGRYRKPSTETQFVVPNADPFPIPEIHG